MIVFSSEKSPTAGRRDAGPAGTAPWPRPPPAGSSARHPRTPSRRSAHAPHQRGSSARPDHQLLDLRQIGIDHPLPVPPLLRRLASRPHLHIPGHRVMITPRQLSRRPVTAREVIRLKNLHDLPAHLHPDDDHRPGTGSINRGDTWPSTGNTLAITGAESGRLRGAFHGRCHFCAPTRHVSRSDDLAELFRRAGRCGQALPHIADERAPGRHRQSRLTRLLSASWSFAGHRFLTCGFALKRREICELAGGGGPGCARCPARPGPSHRRGRARHWPARRPRAQTW
jgi:hypothetical protein